MTPKTKHKPDWAKEQDKSVGGKEAIETFSKGWEHFCKCINWRDSAIDADAVVFMNTIGKQIDEIRASERERCVKAILSLTEYEVEDDELDKGKRAMIDKKEAIDLIKNLDKSGVPQTRRVSGKELK